jgi:hypothetical protein
MTQRRLGVAAAGLAVVLAVAAFGSDALGLGGSSVFGAKQGAALAAALIAAVAALVLLGVMRRETAALLAFALALSAFTVWFQYQGLESEQGVPSATFVESNQLAGHRARLDGVEGDPWRYRLLSAWGADVAIDGMDAVGVERPVLYGFLGFRVLQNLAIFLLAWALYRRLGLDGRLRAAGLVLVAWGMTQSLEDAGLAFDTYSEVALYLAAGVLILERRYAWVVPLAGLAALNRETSGLIPVMLLATAVLAGPRTRTGRRGALLSLAALAAYGAAYGAVRLAVGPADLILPYGHHPGTDLLEYNLERGDTWPNLLRLFTVTPLLALVAVRRWPAELKAIALAVVPVWTIVHLLAAVVAEVRLFLVPYALVVVPGALLLFSRAPSRRYVEREAATWRSAAAIISRRRSPASSHVRSTARSSRAPGSGPSSSTTSQPPPNISPAPSSLSAA